MNGKLWGDDIINSLICIFISTGQEMFPENLHNFLVFQLINFSLKTYCSKMFTLSSEIKIFNMFRMSSLRYVYTSVVQQANARQSPCQLIHNRLAWWRPGNAGMQSISLVNLFKIVAWPRKNCNRNDFCCKCLLKVVTQTTYQKGRKKEVWKMWIICINKMADFCPDMFTWQYSNED